MNPNFIELQNKLYEKIFEAKPIHQYIIVNDEYLNSKSTSIDNAIDNENNELNRLHVSKEKMDIRIALLIPIILCLVPFGVSLLFGIAFYFQLVYYSRDNKGPLLFRIIIVAYGMLVGMIFALPYIYILFFYDEIFDMLSLFGVYVLSLLLYFICATLFQYKFNYINDRIRAIIKTKPNLCFEGNTGDCKKIKEISKFTEIMSIIIFAFDESRYLDLTLSPIQYRILEGSQYLFIDTLQKTIERCREYIHLSKQSQFSINPPIHTYNDGIELIAMSLSQLTPVGWKAVLSSGIVPGLTKFCLLLLPIFIFPQNVYSKYFSELSGDLAFMMILCTFFYCILTCVSYTILIYGGKIRDFYIQMRWLSRLININIQQEIEFGDKFKTFKLNIFCEKTLTTWLKTVLTIYRAWIKYIDLHEIGIKVYFIYMLVFGIFSLTMIFFKYENEPIFMFGYLFLIFPVECMVALLPIIYYLYYGYCVNRVNKKTTLILKSLLRLYTEMNEHLENDDYPQLDHENMPQRQLFFWMILKRELNSNTTTDIKNLKSLAKEKLIRLHNKVENILIRYEDELIYKPYQFCGVLTCNLRTYQTVTISIITAVYGAFLKYVNFMSNAPSSI